MPALLTRIEIGPKPRAVRRRRLDAGAVGDIHRQRQRAAAHGLDLL